MKTTITKSERLQLIGLGTLADKLSNQLEQIRIAVEALTDEDGDAGTGRSSDFVYGHPPGDMPDRVDQLLDRLGINVED